MCQMTYFKVLLKLIKIKLFWDSDQSGIWAFDVTSYGFGLQTLNLYLENFGFEGGFLYRLKWIFAFNFDFDWTVGSGADFALAFRKNLVRFSSIFEVKEIQDSDNFYPNDNDAIVFPI